jgi:hypothetical protein
VANAAAQNKWIAEVDLKLRREWRISAADAGLSKDDLKHRWAEGHPPADFVEWFAEKYDLIRFEREPASRYSSPSL